MTINEGKSEDLRLKIERDALDIILSDRQGLSRKKKFFNYQLEPRKIIVAAAPNFKFKSLRFPQMLNEAPFMQYTRHSYLRSEIDYFFQTHDVKPEVIGETDDLGLIRLAAEKGLCFSVVPENSISDSIKEKKLVKKGELGGINSDLWATMRSNCDPKTSYLLEKTIRKFKGLKA